MLTKESGKASSFQTTGRFFQKNRLALRDALKSAEVTVLFTSFLSTYVHMLPVYSATLPYIVPVKSLAYY